MPTTYSDQFWTLDPFAPPPAGTTLTVSFYDIIDNNNNNLINRFSNDRIDGSDIRQSYPGDTVTVQLANGSVVTITGVTFYLADGRTVFTPSDGSTLENATLVSTTFVTTQASMPVGSLGPPCFTPGTQILSVTGNRPVETLQPGDLVLTADRGAVPICFVRHRTLSPEHLQEFPKHGPVTIQKNAFGPGYPSHDLTVSPQHRMMVRSAITQRMFDEEEILVPACQLTELPGVHQTLPVEGVTYIHLLLDHHAIIFAEDTPTETMFLGKQTHQMLSDRELDEINVSLPSETVWNMQPARLFVRGKRLRKLLERHENNKKPLVSRPDIAALGSDQALSA